MKSEHNRYTFFLVQVSALPGCHNQGIFTHTRRTGVRIRSYAAFVRPMCWQHLHCIVPFVATYVSTFTFRPQSWVMWYIVPWAAQVPAPLIRLSEGREGVPWTVSWSRTPDRRCMTPWTPLPRKWTYLPHIHTHGIFVCHCHLQIVLYSDPPPLRQPPSLTQGILNEPTPI
jgi:hypothetical protein